MGQLEKVADSTVLPKCDILCKIAEFKRTKSANGKLMYKAEFRIIDDGQGGHRNLPIFDQYVIGSDKDKDAKKDETWQNAPGAKTMKRLFKKLALDLTKDVDDLIVDAEDQELGLSLIRYIEPDKRKTRNEAGELVEVDNPYAGQPRNRIAAFWTPGEKAPQILESDEDGAPQAETASAASKPATTTARPKTASAAAEDDDAPARSTKAPKAAPTTDPASAANGSGNGAEGTATAKAGKSEEKTILCPEDGCGVAVPKSRFAQHIAEHDAA